MKPYFVEPDLNGEGLHIGIVVLDLTRKSV